MVRGLFRRFQHDHFFRDLGGDVTEMSDEMRFEMPWWLLGPISAKWIVKPRLAKLLAQRNRAILKAAESQ